MGILACLMPLLARCLLAKSFQYFIFPLFQNTIPYKTTILKSLNQNMQKFFGVRGFVGARVVRFKTHVGFGG